MAMYRIKFNDGYYIDIMAFNLSDAIADALMLSPSKKEENIIGWALV